jgi:hypothetical protein
MYSVLAKSISPEEAQGRLRSITIEFLASSLDDRMNEDRRLCPVRALKAYLAFITPLRKGRRRLFLSTQAPRKEVTKLTFSCWIKKTIRLAYLNSSDQDRAVTGIRAHDVRGFAASWAFKNAVPLLDVLRAGTWENHSTFFELLSKGLVHDP